MSAGVRAHVDCDYFDKDAPPGQRICKEQVDDGRTRTEARRAAKKLGWTVNVHAGSTRAYSLRGGSGFDYCPAHKPGGTPGSREDERSG